VLADFGSAELTGGPRAAASMAGTPLYFAPEQFLGAPSSPATDLYAVGAILWEAATGRALRSHADLIRGAISDRPISADARAAIEAAHGPALLRLLVLFLGDVAARSHGLGLAVEIDL
jgi:serine/threonine protein kinase